MEQFKKVLKWITSILNIFLLILLILVVYSKCITTFTNKTYPSYFGYTLFEVASGSMMPTLSVNDVILVKIDNTRLQENDIIAYSQGRSIITHRIVFIDNNVITTKGDSNNTIDKTINRSQIIGRVVKILPRLGIWKKVFTEPKILAVLFVTLLLFDFALSYQKTNVLKEKKKEENDGEKKIIKTKEQVNKQMVSNGKKDKIDPEKLLEITRKIDLSEINKLLKDEEFKLSDSEVDNLKKEINKVEFEDMPFPKLKKKEQSFLEYTVRLDLNEIQKKINSGVR